jgi:hypothetical protein
VVQRATIWRECHQRRTSGSLARPAVTCSSAVGSCWSSCFGPSGEPVFARAPCFMESICCSGWPLSLSEMIPQSLARARWVRPYRLRGLSTMRDKAMIYVDQSGGGVTPRRTWPPSLTRDDARWGGDGGKVKCGPRRQGSEMTAPKCWEPHSTQQQSCALPWSIGRHQCTIPAGLLSGTAGNLGRLHAGTSSDRERDLVSVCDGGCSPCPQITAPHPLGSQPTPPR